MFDKLTEKLQHITNLSNTYREEDEKINQQILELERMFCQIGIPFDSQYKITEHQSIIWDKEKRGLYVWIDKDKSQYIKLTSLPYDLKRIILKSIAPLLDDIIKKFENELHIENNKKIETPKENKIVSQIEEILSSKKRPGRPAAKK